MKTFFWILLFFTIFKLQAQDVQVTLVDPCTSIEKKSTIIINDNAVAATNTQSTTVIQNNTFNFTLNTSVNTSAGVYNASGNLIRTLWNGVRYTAGTYKAVWSGIMDEGTLAPPGTYQVKVLTNNVQYTWEGVIGNTSASLTDNVFKSYGGNTCFAFVGTKGFYGQFFYEGGTNSRYFNTTDIGRSYDISVGVHAITIDCATDGTNVYWACADQYQNNGTDGNQSNYIFASKVSDNTAVSFTNETTHNSGRENESYSHFIGWFSDRAAGGAYFTGIAVNNNFIFATKQATNQLLVFDKTSGSVVQTLTYTSPGKLAAGGNNELWLISNGSLKKYSVNASTGALSDAGITLTAANPACVRISPDNSTVLITDAGTHQVKAFSNSTGSLLWILGQQGGYDVNGPAVTTDKFMFNHADYASPAIAYQPDGSFWVNDMGNDRTLHFNSNRSYKEQIAYMPSSRSTNADPNTPTRIFGDELEFGRDYSRPLDNGTNGSWKLVKNWKVGTTLDAFRRFTQVVTLSNGHTYASGDNNLYDLTTTGAVLLSSNFLGTNCKIEADGSLYTRYNNNNQGASIGKQPLMSFDNNNMPQWGASATVVTTPDLTPTSPYAFLNNTRGASTNTNRYFFFSPESNSSLPYILNGAYTGIGYHLGAIKVGGNTWEWQASKSTFSRFESGSDYHGDYPRNGDFDIGNNDWGAQHSENCQALINGSNVFWNVNGEFWKANSPGGEVNIWNHFNEDGLLIGNFGKTGLEAALTGNTGYAGNAFSTALVKVGSDFYIYHCDESQHGGVHSWHVSGLNTIAEQTIPIIVSATVVPINDASSLMVGLPYKSTTFIGGSGWTITGTTGSAISTNINTYQKDDPSIYIHGTGTQIVKRSLNNTSQLNTWLLTGSLSFVGTEPTIGIDNYNYLELIDVTGKVICRYFEFADTRNAYNRQLIINNIGFFQGSNGSTEFLKNYNNISFSYTNGRLVFTLGNFQPVTIGAVIDPGADMSKPAFLRVSQSSQGTQNHAIDLCELKFTGM